MSGQSAARDATIKFQNEQGSIVKIHEIACSGYDSCVNTQFLTGYDVALLSLTCAPGACIGCEVRFDATSPAIPCTPTGSEGAMPAVMPTPQPTMFRNQFNAPLDAHAVLGSQIEAGQDLKWSEVDYVGSPLTDAEILLSLVTDDWGERGMLLITKKFSDWAFGR